MSTRATPRVALINLGCRVNRTEVDGFASSFERAGCTIVPSAEEADLVVINTCAVTGEAQTKTRKAIRKVSRMPHAPATIATGCAATLFADEISSLAPEVCVEPDKARVVGLGLELIGIAEVSNGLPACVASTPTPTGRMRPGVKIQDGCDNRCTYCIVWKARGASRSIPATQVVECVRAACARGAHEVVLVGINLGSYSAPQDDVLPRGAGLSMLLDHLLNETDVDRLRLSSIEPPDVCEELLDVMAASHGRVAPFLHVCLQSGCDDTLMRMGRVYDTALFRSVVQMARERMPGIAIGTDVICGFPGETNVEFDASLGFCEEMEFARMHVFRYSPRPGTPAAAAKDQVDARVAAERSVRMRSLAHRMRMRNAASHAGERDLVVVQSKGRAVSSHLFDVAVSGDLEVGAMTEVVLDVGPNGTLVGI